MGTVRTRRQPAPFRAARVVEHRDLGACLRQLVVEGDGLRQVDLPDPAASVRVLLPDDDGALPGVDWNGNEFLRADGSRPTIRTLTPLRVDPERARMELRVVLHGAGPLSAWAAAAEPGTPLATSEFGSGFVPDPTVSSWLLAGDESAIPAVSTLLEHLGDEPEVRVVLERRRPECEVALPAGTNVTIAWCASLVDELLDVELSERDHLWVAGEAAEVQRVRKHLFGDLGIDRSRAHVRGYWKRGRATRG